MKKLLILSIALLAAVPGVEAKCNTCSSIKNIEQKCECGSKKCTCTKAKVCTKCKKVGKKSCKCAAKHKAAKHKGGPVKRTIKATGNVVEDASKVVAGPFEALFGHKEEGHEHKTIHDNDKVNNQQYIDQLEQDDNAESNNNF